MAFTSQFSLSLELNKLVPTAITTGLDFVRLVRELSKSGSHIMVEQDFANVFGRNRIAPHFELSFRAAVRDSSIVESPSFVEIILEAGGGATVRRSIKHPEFFSTVVQLSLLTFTHRLPRLSDGLLRALERRAVGATEMVELPEYRKLLGTLGAIQDQTAGYRWELVSCAIEEKVVDEHKLYRHLPRSRYILQLVLQGLLNTLTALQRWEQHFLRICLGTGVAAVVAWVHHVLGLPVSVIGDGGSKTTFGTEPVRVLVEMVDLDNLQSHASQAVVLFSSAGQAHIDFELYTHPYEVHVLEPASRHTVLGFVTQVFSSEDVRRPDLRVQLAQLVVAMCLSAQRESIRQWDSQNEVPESQWILPSENHLYAIGAAVFAESLCRVML